MTATEPDPDPRLYTVDEACAVLRIEKTKFYKLVRDGELATVKLPPGTQQSGTRVEEKELRLFIENNRVPRSPAAR